MCFFLGCFVIYSQTSKDNQSNGFENNMFRDLFFALGCIYIFKTIDLLLLLGDSFKDGGNDPS